MKKISIVLPTGGNDLERRRNLEECLRCIEQQTVEPFEVIIVEQELDGNHYNDDLQCDQYIQLSDPENRGFNVSWCRNVGVYASSGDVVLLMDGDYVFPTNYLEQIQKVDAPFFSGTKMIYWSDDNVVKRYLAQRDFKAVQNCRKRLVPFIRGVANGGIVGFHRGWYINHFIGYCENFFNYGYEDNEAVNRICKLLNKQLKQLATTDISICHLAHKHRVVSPETNAGLYEAISNLGWQNVAIRMKEAGVGKIDAPGVISSAVVSGSNAARQPSRVRKAKQRGTTHARSSELRTKPGAVAPVGNGEAFTILIPNYNKAKYLRECIDSVVAQTTDNWHCVIVDDGSVDGSLDILLNDERLRDERFKIYYNEENLGNASCLNQLVDLAPTDIVGVLDSDDALEPDCIEKVLNAYAESYKGFVYTNFRYCDENLKKKGPGYCKPLPPGKTALEADCVSAFRTFRVSEYKKTEGVDTSLTSAIDKDLILKMEEVTSLHFINEPLYLYRMLSNSLSMGGGKNRIAKANHEKAKAAARERRKKRPSNLATNTAASPVATVTTDTMANSASRPNIHTYIAHAQDSEKDLGTAYNQVFELIPNDEDWVCFIDHDAMFTTTFWYQQLIDIVRAHPKVGMFTAMTNRVYNKAQLYGGMKNENHDVRLHRNIGQRLFDQKYSKVKPLGRSQLLSGVLMMMKKSVWKEHKFQAGFLGVDNRIHSDLLDGGHEVMLMEGVYVYHWYRGDGDKSHLSKVKQIAVKADSAVKSNGSEDKAQPPAEKKIDVLKPTRPKEKVRYHSEVSRTAIINAYAKKYGYQTYLEIGVRDPNDNFNHIVCKSKDSVDPDKNARAMYRLTSDNFFAKIPADKKYDLIFIDGMHEGGQVIKDITNSLKHLNEGGTILMHDCNPPTAWHARSYKQYLAERGDWNGTTYQAFVDFRRRRDDLEMFVVDTDWGVGVIRRGSQKPFEHSIDTYADFDKHRTDVLNLKSVSELRQLEEFTTL